MADDDRFPREPGWRGPAGPPATAERHEPRNPDLVHEPGRCCGGEPGPCIDIHCPSDECGPEWTRQNGPLVNACQLCPKSPTYWRIKKETTR